MLRLLRDPEHGRLPTIDRIPNFNLETSLGPTSPPPSNREDAQRAADDWQAREQAEAAALQAVRQRIVSEKDTLDATRRRIDAEANYRKHAMLRADADAEATRLARERLDAAREATDAHRLRQAAEAEAESLAKIRIQTERQLAAQEQVCADAARAAELAALARTQADNAAAQQARQRELAAIAACDGVTAQLAAERVAEAAAGEQREALQRLDELRRTQRETETEAAQLKGNRWAAAWARLRYASPLLIGAVALLVGGGLGVLLAMSGGLGAAASRASVLPRNAPGVEAQLRLDTNLAGPVSASAGGVAAGAASNTVVDLPPPVRR